MTNKVTMLSETPFLNFMSLAGTHNGDSFTWTMASRNKEPKFMSGTLLKPDAVHLACRVFVEGVPHLLVTKEFRHPLNNYQIGFPAGLIDEGETALDAAKRELFEESNMTLLDVHHTSMVQVKSSGLSDESGVVFYCDAEGDPSSENVDSGEDIHNMLWTQEDVQNFLDAEQEYTLDITAEHVFCLFAKTGLIHPNQF